MLSFRLNFMLLVVLQVFCTNAARILAIYPTPSISHQVVFRPITEELLKRGHEVIVVTTDPMFPNGQAPENLTEIDIHDVGYSTWQEALVSLITYKNVIFSQLKVMSKVMIQVMNKIFSAEEVKNLIKGKEKFDLLLTEHLARPLLPFSHIYKVPLIQISSFGAVHGSYKTFGAPSHPLLYPSNLHRRINNMTILEKLEAFYFNYKFNNLMSASEIEENNLIQKHFPPNTPSVAELEKNIDMVFLNINPIWEGIRPVPSNVIHMGGLPSRPDKPLSADLESYLDSSKNGVIYISFGTNVKTNLISPEILKQMVVVLSKLPYDVLWKWDTDELPGKSSNIKISKWLPQSDLLKHPKIRLFITQGGLQSNDETILAGVPAVVVPMLADQWFNAEKYEYHRIGVKLEATDINEESFSKAIKTVLKDKSYRENIIKLRNRMYDQPQQPLERALWWIEYVMRHGGAKHLRSPAAFITWREYLELDLVAVVLFVLISLILVSITILYSLYKLLTRKKKSAGVQSKVKKN